MATAKKRYDVWMKAEAKVSGIVHVRAHSEEEAREIAVKELEKIRFVVDEFTVQPEIKSVHETTPIDFKL